MLHAQAWLPEFISKAGMVHHIQGATERLLDSYILPSGDPAQVQQVLKSGTVLSDHLRAGASSVTAR